MRSTRMRRYHRTIALAVATLGIALTAGWTTTAQQPAVGSQVRMPHYDEPGDIANLPMLGRWKINAAKSTQNGSRANSDTFTWIFRVEGNKIRHDIYDVYPADKPSRSYAVMLNGSEAKDPHEVGIGETISWWPINRSMIYREVKQNGKVTQHTIYSVSPDGKVFTSQSWSPTSPNPRGMSNLMYFERQEGPVGSK
jgi:hypothetical protein